MSKIRAKVIECLSDRLYNMNDVILDIIISIAIVYNNIDDLNNSGEVEIFLNHAYIEKAKAFLNEDSISDDNILIEFSSILEDVIEYIY